VIEVVLDQMTGKFRASVDGQPVDVLELGLGRIAAQTAKQMIIQKTRERERTSIFQEFTERINTILTGTVVRAEGGNLIVNVGRTEGFLPRSEQIPGETHQPGERIRVLILEVREQPVMVRRSAGREGEFAYREAKSLVVVYLDPADGQVKERVADIDRNNPEYARLRQEVESQS